MKQKTSLYVIVTLILLGIWSCNENSKGGELIEDNIVKEETLIEDSFKQEFYQMPSPMELFMFLWEDGAPFKVDNLNSVENIDAYVNSKTKAINLGIYSADLAYCTVYDRNKETMSLFSATKDLAEDLGLIEGFDKTILERVDKNIDNPDSLFVITKDSYAKTIAFLQTQGQIQILPYIIYGGWLESVYIANQSIKKYIPESDIAERISDQGILLDNLIDFFGTLPKTDLEAQGIIKDLKFLRISFESKTTKDGLNLPKEAYVEVKQQIETLRTKITK